MHILSYGYKNQKAYISKNIINISHTYISNKCLCTIPPTKKPQPNYFGLFIFYSIQILLFICGIILFILARKTPSKMLKTATLLPLIGILFFWIGILIVKYGIPPYPGQPDLYMQFVAFSPILLGTISVILSILSFIKTEKKLLVLGNLIYTIIYSLLAFYLLVAAVRPQ